MTSLLVEGGERRAARIHATETSQATLALLSDRISNDPSADYEDHSDTPAATPRPHDPTRSSGRKSLDHGQLTRKLEDHHLQTLVSPKASANHDLDSSSLRIRAHKPGFWSVPNGDIRDHAGVPASFRTSTTNNEQTVFHIPQHPEHRSRESFRSGPPPPQSDSSQSSLLPPLTPPPRPPPPPTLSRLSQQAALLTLPPPPPLPPPSSLIHDSLCQSGVNKPLPPPPPLPPPHPPSQALENPPETERFGGDPSLWSLLYNTKSDTYRFHLLPFELSNDGFPSRTSRTNTRRVNDFKHDLGTRVVNKERSGIEEEVTRQNFRCSDEDVLKITLEFTGVVKTFLEAMNARHRVDHRESATATMSREVGKHLGVHASDIGQFLVSKLSAWSHSQRRISRPSDTEQQIGLDKASPDVVVRYAVKTAKRRSIADSYSHQLKSHIRLAEEIIRLRKRLVELEPDSSFAKLEQTEDLVGSQAAFSNLKLEAQRANRYRRSLRAISKLSSLPQRTQTLLTDLGSRVLNLPDELTWETLHRSLEAMLPGRFDNQRKKRKGSKKKQPPFPDTGSTIVTGTSYVPQDMDQEDQDTRSYPDITNPFAGLDSEGYAAIQLTKEQERTNKLEERVVQQRKAESSMRLSKQMNQALAAKQEARQHAKFTEATKSCHDPARPISPASSIVTVIPISQHKYGQYKWAEPTAEELREIKTHIWQLANPDKELSEYVEQRPVSFKSILEDQAKDKLQDLGKQSRQTLPTRNPDGTINVAGVYMEKSMYEHAKSIGIPTLFDYTRQSRDIRQGLESYGDTRMLRPAPWHMRDLKHITAPHINVSHIPGFLQGLEPNPRGTDTTSKWFALPSTTLASMRKTWDQYFKDKDEASKKAYDRWKRTIPPKHWKSEDELDDTMEYVLLKRFFSKPSKKGVELGSLAKPSSHKGVQGNVYVGDLDDDKLVQQQWVDDRDIYGPVSLDPDWYRGSSNSAIMFNKKRRVETGRNISYGPHSGPDQSVPQTLAEAQHQWINWGASQAVYGHPSSGVRYDPSTAYFPFPPSFEGTTAPYQYDWPIPNTSMAPWGMEWAASVPIHDALYPVPNLRPQWHQVGEITWDDYSRGSPGDHVPLFDYEGDAHVRTFPHLGHTAPPPPASAAARQSSKTHDTLLSTSTNEGESDRPQVPDTVDQLLKRSGDAIAHRGVRTRSQSDVGQDVMSIFAEPQVGQDEGKVPGNEEQDRSRCPTSSRRHSGGDVCQLGAERLASMI